MAQPGYRPVARPDRWGPLAARLLPARGAHPPGVGIGLSLVIRFAELHGGRAWVQDRPGGGASFRVLLPDRSPTGRP
ncbi:MAG TPA: ATP-binding protein [Streptosporangiaceae bacterium]